MSSKSKEDYSQLFRDLKDQAVVMEKSFNPVTIYSDFESGLLPAVREEFPTSIHRGCYFHFTQAIYRQVQQLGLQQANNEDEDLRIQIRELMSLGFVPIVYVREVFDILRRRSLPQLAELLLYFERQWLLQTPATMWNVYGVSRRTNNDLEGWHRRFNGTVSKHHPNIFALIEAIMREQDATEVTVNQIRGGQRVNRVNKKYQAINSRIEDATRKFNRREINVLEYLRRVTRR